jgi:hypothetical protein
MEHRWGERIGAQVTVELSCGALPSVAGLLVNLSASGAFVHTGGCRLPRGAVELTLVSEGGRDGSSVRLPAYIVRESESGVGIEWCEFAPRIVRELMARGRRDRRGGALSRARALATVSQHRRGGPETLPEPAAPPAAEPTAAGANTM